MSKKRERGSYFEIEKKERKKWDPKREKILGFENRWGEFSHHCGHEEGDGDEPVHWGVSHSRERSF